jgi:hypothetical protein
MICWTAEIHWSTAQRNRCPDHHGVLASIWVFKHNRDKGGEREQIGVGVIEDPFQACPEDDASKADLFSAAGPVGLGIFAGAHSEEVGP